MDKKLVRNIRSRLESKSTKELLIIWETNNTDQWSEAAFEAVREILTDRNVDIPDQKPAPAKAPTNETTEKLERIVIKVCIGVGGGIGAIYAFFESFSYLKKVPGGGGTAGSVGMGMNILALSFLGGIIGGLIGLFIKKFIIK